MIGVFRGMRLAGFPGPLRPFWVAIEVEADPDEVGVRVVDLRFVDEDGRVLWGAGIEFVFERRSNYGPNYAFFYSPFHPEIQVPSPGVYALEVVQDGVTLARTRLAID